MDHYCDFPFEEHRTKTDSDLFDSVQEALDAGFNVFMNNQAATLDITKTVDAEVKKVTLFNYLGQTMQIWSNNVSNNQLNLPVNKVSTGVYILKIETNNKTISKKIIIE